MITITSDTINSLADKLSSLDLSDAERYVLDRLIERAGQFDAEVSGFVDNYDGLDSGGDLSADAQALARSAGLIP